jgi:hypothetical protein
MIDPRFDTSSQGFFYDFPVHRIFRKYKRSMESIKVDFWEWLFLLFNIRKRYLPALPQDQRCSVLEDNDYG